MKKAILICFLIFVCHAFGLEARASMDNGGGLDWVMNTSNLGIHDTLAPQALTLNGNFALKDQAGDPSVTTNYGNLYNNNGDLYYQNGSSIFLVNNMSVLATVAADSLDFDDFADSMTLDADTTIDINSKMLSFGTGNNLYINGSTGKVGFNMTNPAYMVDVTGSMQASADIHAGDDVFISDDAYLGDMLQHQGDTNTWIRFPANDQVQIQAGTSLRMDFIEGASDYAQLNNGNLGIGATPSTFKLEVAGGIGPDGDGTRDLGSSSRRFDTAFVTMMNIITADTSANGKLAIKNTSTGDASMYFREDTGANGYAMGFDNSDGDKFKISYAGSGTPALGTGDLFTIQTDGNVGIGTTSPSANLDVSGRIAVADSSGTSVFIGTNSGANDDASDNRNAALGVGALNANTDGYNNVAIGFNGLSLNTSGYMNIAIGKDALKVNTTGDANVAIGNNALKASVTTNNNVAVGHVAMEATTTGIRNTALGFGTMQLNTTGERNTAVGFYSLYGNTVNGYNTAVGHQTLYNNQGVENTAIGYNALIANTHGERNIAVGSYTLDSNPTGVRNTAIGYGALSSIQNASYLTALGYGAMLAGDDNGIEATAVGYNALYNNDADGNTAVGYGAMDTVTTGARNTAVGAYALDAITTNGHNTAVGRAALTTTTGGENTALGEGAGYNITTGNKNTIIGDDAGQDITTGSNNIMIGESADTGSNMSNRLNIGNTIYGDVSTGNVGIGTSTVTAHKLNVSGTAGLSTGTAWTNTSDIRLKDIDGDYGYGLSEIMKLHAVRFHYKKDNARDMPSDIPLIGFVAQEVQPIFPEAVSQGKDGYLDFNIHPINVAVINALQELKKQNDILKQELCSKDSSYKFCE